MSRIDYPAACPDFLEVFTDFVDGNLSPEHESEIRAHLDCCEACLRHLAAYRRGVMTLKASERDVDPSTFWNGLEKRLWTGGHLAGGRADGRTGDADWVRPTLVMAAAACFAVVVFFAGTWGDRTLRDAREGGGDRPVVTTASVAAGSPIVVESEPIEIPASVTEATVTARPAARGARLASAPAEPSGGGAAIVPASLGASPDPVETTPDRDPVDRVAEAAYVASLQRELAAWEAIERTRQRAAREGLRRDLDGSRMAADGWVAPVRLGNAGPRTLRARASVDPWPVEAAVSLP